MAKSLPVDEIIDDAEFLGLEPAETPASAHPILSAEEVDAARAKARKRIENERKVSAMRQIEDQETERLRREEGLVSGISGEDVMVWVTIDLPPEAASIAINGEAYHHGHSYPVPKHVQRSLAEQMQASWRSHDLADGKSTSQMFQGRRNSKVDGKTGIVDNAPRRFDAVH